MSARILVPLDGSALAEVVLPYGRELAKSFQADVLWLLTVRRAI